MGAASLARHLAHGDAQLANPATLIEEDFESVALDECRWIISDIGDPRTVSEAGIVNGEYVVTTPAGNTGGRTFRVLWTHQEMSGDFEVSADVGLTLLDEAASGTVAMGAVATTGNADFAAAVWLTKVNNAQSTFTYCYVTPSGWTYTNSVSLASNARFTVKRQGDVVQWWVSEPGGPAQLMRQETGAYTGTVRFQLDANNFANFPGMSASMDNFVASQQ